MPVSVSQAQLERALTILNVLIKNLTNSPGDESVLSRVNFPTKIRMVRALLGAAACHQPAVIRADCHGGDRFTLSDRSTPDQAKRVS
jgi:hypothetical protein